MGCDADVPTILFGAFDRHNFGDLLFPHVAAAMLPGRNFVFAGLAERDLSACGGHRVRALAQLAAAWHDRPVNLVHVGGEVLTCDAWQAAVMLQAPEEVQRIVARLDGQPEARREWTQELLGIPALAPYTVPRGLFPHAVRVVYNAVGGVELDACEPAMRKEVVANLWAADAVSVRDRRTQAQLERAGVAARLVPDPAAMVAELFGARIGRHAREGEVARIRASFPRGYLAVQFGADFGDDATLAEIAAQLERVTIASGHGVVFFRAGAAPWHDDLSCFERAAARFRHATVRIFTSLDLWDICALIAQSRGYCGSSLHGRIVAMAYALPRINLVHAEHVMQPGKQAAYAATWEPAGTAAVVAAPDIAEGMLHALARDRRRLLQIADALAAECRAGFEYIG